MSNRENPSIFHLYGILDEIKNFGKTFPFPQTI